MTDPTPTLLQRLRARADEAASLADKFDDYAANIAARTDLICVARSKLRDAAQLAHETCCEAEGLRQELDTITGESTGEFQSKTEEDLWTRIVGDLAGEHGADCAAMIADRAVVLYRARRSKVEGF